MENHDAKKIDRILAGEGFFPIPRIGQKIIEFVCINFSTNFLFRVPLLLKNQAIMPGQDSLFVSTHQI